MEIVVKAVLVLAGIIVFMMVLMSLARRKMTETFCLMWGVLALIMICAGCFLSMTEWGILVGKMGTFLIFLAAACIICGGLFICIQVSMLMRKNQELAMQISLLNQENKQILDELERISREEDDEDETEKKEDIICREHTKPGRGRSGAAGADFPRRSQAI
jgi:uncharacterized membrane protein